MRAVAGIPHGNIFFNLFYLTLSFFSLYSFQKCHITKLLDQTTHLQHPLSYLSLTSPPLTSPYFDFDIFKRSSEAISTFKLYFGHNGEERRLQESGGGHQPA